MWGQGVKSLSLLPEQGDVHGVKRDEEPLCAPELLESLDDARLAVRRIVSFFSPPSSDRGPNLRASIPHVLLVGSTVVQIHVSEALRQMFLVPCRLVVQVDVVVKRTQPV